MAVGTQSGTSGQGLGQRGQERLGALAGVLSHQGVHDDQRGHGLDNGDGAGSDAGVVTALGFEDTLAEVVGGGVLGLADGGRGLEGNAEVDVGAVGDTALDTTGVVGLGGEALLGGGVGAELGRDIGDDEGVVVDGAGDLAASEAGADLEALGGGDAEHGVGELGLELVEAGLTQTDGDVADHAGDGTADAVVVVAELLDHLGHARGGIGVGAAGGRELVDGGTGDGLEEVEVFGVGGGSGVLGSRGEQVLVANGGDEGDNLNAVREAQVLFGDGTGSHTACNPGKIVLIGIPFWG